MHRFFVSQLANITKGEKIKKEKSEKVIATIAGLKQFVSICYKSSQC